MADGPKFERNLGSDGSHGIHFEWETTLLTYLRCEKFYQDLKQNNDTGVKSFFVANNVKGVGAFDDVVTRLEYVEQEKFICYYGVLPTWREIENNPTYLEHYMPLQKCTHVVHAFAYVDCDGSLVLQQAFEFLIRNGQLEQRVKSMNQNTKFMLSLYISDEFYLDFLEVITDQEALSGFFENLLQILNEGKMDGVDLYWLGPGIEDTEEAKANFDSFLIELRERLPTKKISVTVSRDPEVILNAYNFSTIIKKANFINVATYDYHTFKDGVTGYHAPLFSQDNQNSVNTTVTALLEAGVPKHKIVVGFSTRAQTYLVQEDDAPPGTPIVGTPTLENENDVEGTFEHYKVCSLQRTGTSMESRSSNFNTHFYFRPAGQTNYTWFSYYDTWMMHTRGLWVSASKLGGVMLQVFPVIPQCLLQCFYCGNFTVFEALHDGMRTCPGEAMEALAP